MNVRSSFFHRFALALVATPVAMVALGACGGPDAASHPPATTTTTTIATSFVTSGTTATAAMPFSELPDRREPSASSSAQPPSSGSIRYVALGDSFTIGTGSTPEDAFPARLTNEWSTCPITLTNLAKNGFTSDDVLTVEVPRLAELKPSFVTIAAGANDIVQHVSEDDYRKHLTAIFQAVTSAGVRKDRTVALPQPDWSLSPAGASFGDPRRIAQQIERYNAILKEETAAAGARYVDLFPLMRDLAQKHELASDRLHPSKAAHSAWAKALAGELGPCTAYQ